MCQSRLVRAYFYPRTLKLTNPSLFHADFDGDADSLGGARRLQSDLRVGQLDPLYAMRVHPGPSGDSLSSDFSEACREILFEGSPSFDLKSLFNDGSHTDIATSKL